MSDNEDSDAELEEDVEELLFTRDFDAEAQVISENLLPSKSSKRYKLAYDYFMSWKNLNHEKKVNENMLLVYFEELSQRLKPSTMWSIWSMLKSTLSIHDSVDLESFHRLKSFLKLKTKGYKPKKAPALTAQQIKAFLKDSDDYIYLVVKVILIFGICGGLRCDEITKVTLNDVTDSTTHFLVYVNENKNYYPRNFIIGKHFYSIVKKYFLLRPADTDTNRFFIRYEKGKCVRSPIGKNKIAETPRTIASFLNFSDFQRYTGHSLRRTAATLLSNAGANAALLKQAFGWKSNAMPDCYVEHSVSNRAKIYDGIVSDLVSHAPVIIKLQQKHPNRSSEMVNPTLAADVNSLVDNHENDLDITTAEPSDSLNNVGTEVTDSSVPDSTISLLANPSNLKLKANPDNVSNLNAINIPHSDVKSPRFAILNQNQSMFSNRNSNKASSHSTVTPTTGSKTNDHSTTKRRDFGSYDDDSGSDDNITFSRSRKRACADRNKDFNFKNADVKFESCTINHLTINNYH